MQENRSKSEVLTLISNPQIFLVKKRSKCSTTILRYAQAIFRRDTLCETSRSSLIGLPWRTPKLARLKTARRRVRMRRQRIASAGLAASAYYSERCGDHGDLSRTCLENHNNARSLRGAVGRRRWSGLVCRGQALCAGSCRFGSRTRMGRKNGKELRPRPCLSLPGAMEARGWP